MKTLLFLLALGLLPTDASAAIKQYLIESKIVVEGRELSHPRVVVNEGKVAEMESSTEGGPSLSLKLQPSRLKGKAILVDVDLVYRREGRKVGANLAVGLELGRPASIELRDEADRPVGELIIKADDLSVPGAAPIEPLCTGG